MIVSCTAPAGATAVRYGGAQMLVDEDGTIAVPAYVAKALVAQAGFTSAANLSKSVSALLAAGDPDEVGYLFQAHGRATPVPTVISHAGEEAEGEEPIPDEVVPVDKLALAAELLAARGEPTAAVV